MIKAIPGMSVESSGGDGPGSIRVRGLPSGGYAFLGVMEDGLPVLSTGYSTSPSPDQLYKVDLNIKNVEAIRGGHAAMYLAGTPGALINILSETGNDNKLTGKVKYSRGLLQNANRFDVNLGGPLAENLKFSIGGFYRKDEGARPPAYTANDGGQFKGNITYEMKRGSYLRFHAKHLNDKTTWLVPSYYSFDGTGQARALPYFDPLTEILAPSEKNITLNVPDGRTINFNFGDGVRTKVTSGQIDFKYNTINEWSIRNNMRYQVSNGLFIGSIVTAELPFNPTINYYYSNGQELANPTGYYTGNALVYTKSDDRQFMNNLDFYKKLGSHGVTFGASLHYYDLNSIGTGASFNTEIKNQPSIILVGTNNSNGFTGISTSSYSDGKTLITSGFLSDEIKIGRATLDLGVRLDNFNVKGERLINTSPFTNTTPYDESKLHSTFSAGLNYNLNSRNALYARATKTYSALNVGNYSAFNFDPDAQKRRDIIMAEIGYKTSSDQLALFGSLVYATLNNIAASMGIPNKSNGLTTIGTFASSRNLSAELEAIYTPLPNLNFRLVGTLQNSVYTNYSVIAPADARDDLAGKPFDWSGNSPERIPNFMADLSVNYNYNIFNFFLGYRQIGKRWATPSNVFRFNGYNEIGAGLEAKVTKNIGLRIWGDNLANSRGLTEGNIRRDQFLALGNFEKGSLQIGRVILPRSLWASLTLSF